MDSSTLNLNIVKTETAPCSLALKVEVLPPRVKKSFNEVIATYSKQAKVPGFRAGKVPAAVILKRFGAEVVEQTKGKLIEKAYGDAIESEKIRPVSQPELKEADELAYNQDKPFAFSVELEVVPEIALPDYKGIKLTRTKYVADESSVTELLESLQERNTKYDKTDSPAAEKDMVRADYKATIPQGVETTDKSKYILNGENSWLVLKKPEMLPGITEALKGHVAGDEVDADIAFPEDHYNKEIAGKTFSYHIKINEVHAATVPELNDDLAKTVGASTLQQLKDRIAENQKAQADSVAAEEMRKQVSDFLVAAADFQLPPKVLERQKNSLAARQYSEKLRAGAKKEDLEPKKDEMLKKAEEEAVRQLKLEFIVDAIADAEKVSVEQNEILNVIQQYAQMQGVKPEDMVKQMSEKNEFPAIYQSIRHQKALDAVVKLGQITEVDPA